MGRFHLSKSLKRRRGGSHKDMPELMDLGDNVYIPEMGTEVPSGTMKSLSKRPNRLMVDEARYTDRNMENTMKQPLRRRPIEFVKAQEVYDPSKDLIDLLRKSKAVSLTEGMELLKVEEEAQTLDPQEIVDEKETMQEQEQEPLENMGPVEEIVDEVEPAALEVPVSVADVEEMMEETVEVEVQDEEEELVEEEAEEEAEEEEEDIAVDAPEEESESAKESDGESEAEILDQLVPEDYEMADVEPEDELFLIDEEGDNSILEKHGVRRLTTEDVIKQRLQPKKAHRKVEVEFAQAEAFLEHDPYVTVGGVMMKTLKADDGTVNAELPTLAQLNKLTTKGFEELAPPYMEESEDSDDEAAFEDYMAQIMKANAGDDPDDIEYDSEVYVSSDNSQGQLDAYIDDFGDEDGLEDIVSFARLQQKSFADLDFPPTQTLKTKGKGKKERILFEEGLEMELRESLLEQFHYQKLSRRDKKLRKKARLQQEGLQNNDLNVKYDYSIHVKEMKQEFEEFLHDGARDSMTFPPLDSHGNKTINKIATHYNMRCTRCGNGLQTFMKVSKNRKTFHYLPRYDQIAFVLRQRPVFRRTDVKARTRDEIEQTDAKKTKRGEPSSNAHVQEGHIVGGEAPEIDNNNIGRKLLEKLGWVKGEGLGAQGNKGISVPLMATVKKSKTGLK